MGKTLSTPDWLSHLRQDAWFAFEKQGLPTTRSEDWKYTSLSSLKEFDFRATDAPRYSWPDPVITQVKSALKERSMDGQHKEIRLVFIDGEYCAALSDTVLATPAQSGVKVLSLGQTLKDLPQGLQKPLETFHSQSEDGVKFLNTACFKDGAVLRVSPNQSVSSPIHFVFVRTADTAKSAYYRNLISVEKGAKAQVVETYLGLDSRASQQVTNSVTQVSLEESANLELIRIQLEAPSGCFLGDLRVNQEKNSEFTGHWVSLGASLARNETRVEFQGEGSTASLNGLYFGKEKQHTDSFVLIHHASPHCNSHQKYKGVLDGSALGVFSGKIEVALDAQKSNATQVNRNLLLSKQAQAYTRPQLQIHADDVKCSHGATVGQLDDQALFYLRSRGISKDDSRRLLTEAFAGEVLDQLKNDTLKAQIKIDFAARLGRVS
ncbi:Fe-S cluster assembly protein SufD [bacterium]|nr:Fe-S cluster assembly protein SufD [bacterium]